MEIIDELEPSKRGIYGGACGYLSFAGDMDVAIAIRTGIVKDGTLYVQAAAGVVADSVPEMEWKETEHKARALIRRGAGRGGFLRWPPDCLARRRDARRAASRPPETGTPAARQPDA